MNRHSVVILLLILLVLPLHAEQTGVLESDLSLSLKSVVLAVATGYTATLLTPRIEFENASFELEGDLSSFSYQADDADIGKMRVKVLDAPPPQITPKGFFEMLFESIQSLLPNYLMMAGYLERQQLYENELFLTGQMDARRRGDTYPFRYEGSGQFTVHGRRVENPVSFSFTFQIPLEGEQGGSVVLQSLYAEGIDYTERVRGIFHLN
ncbi:MAG: hypothetical protein ACOCJN_05815 [Spirochaetaceae bacterium JB067]